MSMTMMWTKTIQSNKYIAMQISTHNLQNFLSTCDTVHEQKQKNKPGMKFDPLKFTCFTWSDTRNVSSTEV